MEFKFKSIGIIHTPYKDIAPFLPEENAEGEFYVELNPEYKPALFKLETFSHVIVIFCFDRTNKVNLMAHPPHWDNVEVGLFASRSPHRINHIGMNILRLKKIEDNRIYTSGMDILDNTPLLDIKPYVPMIDLKPNANNGWIDDMEIPE